TSEILTRAVRRLRASRHWARRQRRNFHSPASRATRFQFRRRYQPLHQPALDYTRFAESEALRGDIPAGREHSFRRDRRIGLWHWRWALIKKWQLFSSCHTVILIAR